MRALHIALPVLTLLAAVGCSDVESAERRAPMNRTTATPAEQVPAVPPEATNEATINGHVDLPGAETVDVLSVKESTQ